MCVTIDSQALTWSCSGVRRIPLVVKDDFATRLDRAVALLALKTGQRQTRTSLIVRAVEAEIARLEATSASEQPTEH